MPKWQLGFQCEVVKHVLLCLGDIGQCCVCTELPSDHLAPMIGSVLQCFSCILWAISRMSRSANAVTSVLSVLTVSVDKSQVSILCSLPVLLGHLWWAWVCNSTVWRGVGKCPTFSQPELCFEKLRIKIEYWLKATLFFKGKHSLFQDISNHKRIYNKGLTKIPSIFKLFLHHAFEMSSPLITWSLWWPVPA